VGVVVVGVVVVGVVVVGVVVVCVVVVGVVAVVTVVTVVCVGTVCVVAVLPAHSRGAWDSSRAMPSFRRATRRTLTPAGSWSMSVRAWSSAPWILPQSPLLTAFWTLPRSL
jgi:hypothetical protein